MLPWQLRPASTFALQNGAANEQDNLLVESEKSHQLRESPPNGQSRIESARDDVVDRRMQVPMNRFGRNIDQGGMIVVPD